jgi:predicted dehydrogenase
MGNNGSHYVDIARWFMNKRLPTRIQSAGGRFGMNDQGQTPNVQNATYIYEDGKILEMQVRNVYTPEPSQFHFYGTKGYMHFQEDVLKHKFDFEIYMGANEQPEPELPRNDSLRGASDHYEVFARAARENRPELLTCDIEEARISANLCLLADISYRLGREVKFDPKTERFADSDANAMLTREYRKPYVLPEKV